MVFGQEVDKPEMEIKVNEAEKKAEVLSGTKLLIPYIYLDDLSFRSKSDSSN
jgi:hypothetical protein